MSLEEIRAWCAKNKTQAELYPVPELLRMVDEAWKELPLFYQRNQNQFTLAAAIRETLGHARHIEEQH